MKDYTRSDVRAAKARIAAACPGLTLDDWQDYGYTLVAYREVGHGFTIVFQPPRPENGQEAIAADIDEVIRKFGGTP